MAENRRGRRMAKRKKKFNPFKTFFKIVCSMVSVFMVLAGGAAFAYYKVTGDVPFSNQEIIQSASDMNLLDAFLKRDIKMNVAVFGVDKDGTRTDVIFVAHYDSAQKSINLVSLPRDTRVSICDEVRENLNKEGRSYNQVAKLNAVHSYSGKEMGPKNAVLQIEDLLGIKIDHYVKVDLEGFREIVDAVGGVDVDVPQDMHWDMRDTGDPLIDLKKGMQHLDGEKAEQLVRFRRYAEIERTEQRCQEYLCDDADYVIVAFGATSRGSQSADTGAAAFPESIGGESAEYGKHHKEPAGLYQNFLSTRGNGRYADRCAEIRKLYQ